jgi:hypothetical protein
MLYELLSTGKEKDRTSMTSYVRTLHIERHHKGKHMQAERLQKEEAILEKFIADYGKESRRSRQC